MCVCMCKTIKLFSVYRFVVNEMVQTEKDYVKDLGTVVEVTGMYLN